MIVRKARRTIQDTVQMSLKSEISWNEIFRSTRKRVSFSAVTTQKAEFLDLKKSINWRGQLHTLHLKFTIFAVPTAVDVIRLAFNFHIVKDKEGICQRRNRRGVVVPAGKKNYSTGKSSALNGTLQDLTSRRDPTTRPWTFAALSQVEYRQPRGGERLCFRMKRSWMGIVVEALSRNYSRNFLANTFAVYERINLASDLSRRVFWESRTRRARQWSLLVLAMPPVNITIGDIKSLLDTDMHGVQ